MAQAQGQAPPGHQYICYFCEEFRTPNPADLQAHWHNKQPIACTYPGCRARLACNVVLRIHREVQHNIRDAGNVWICNHCGGGFPSDVRLNLHRGNYGQPPLRCTTCGFSGRCSVATALHMAAEH